MPRTKIARFGPGSLESITLHTWAKPRTQGRVVIAEARGFYTVYCGSGNTHTVPITARCDAHRDTTADPDGREDLLLRAHDGDPDAAASLAWELVQDALEDWRCACDALTAWCDATGDLVDLQETREGLACSGCDTVLDPADLDAHHRYADI